MPYLSSHRGDYLASSRGDPGFFSFIGKAIKGAAGVVGKLGIPIVSGVAGVIAGRGTQPISRAGPTLYQQPIMTGQRMPGGAFPTPGIPGAIQRALPGGKTGYMTGARRRRMNPANPKALRRAIRRQASFVKLARRALKGSGYSITARGSRRARPISIRESGPGGVSVSR